MTGSSNFPETIAFDELPPEKALEYVYTAYKPILESILARRLRRPRDDDEVQERVHDFFTRKLAPDRSRGQASFLEKWDPSRGKFRSFLLCSFENFLRSYRSKPLGPLEIDVAAPPRPETAPAEEDIEWIINAFDLALARFEDQAKETYQHVLRRYDIEPAVIEGATRPTYDEIARELGLTNEKVTGILNRARQKFYAHLRDVLREYAPNQSREELDAEYDVAVAAIGAPNFAHVRGRIRKEMESVDGTIMKTFGTMAGLESQFLGSVHRLFAASLRHLPMDVDGRLADVAAQLPAHLNTLEDVIGCFRVGEPDRDKPTLEVLKALKDGFKRVHQVMDKAEWKIVYCALTSAAVLGYGERAIGEFTRNSPEQILDNTRRVRRKYRDQIPPTVELVFRDCIESLETN